MCDKCASCQEDFNPEYGGFDRYILHADDFFGKALKEFHLFEKDICIECWKEFLYGEHDLSKYSYERLEKK